MFTTLSVITGEAKPSGLEVATCGSVWIASLSLAMTVEALWSF
jgi:hypothetical protein